MQPIHSAGVRRVLNHAHAIAGRYKHRFVHTEYLLLGLLQERNSATQILKSLGHEREQLRNLCKAQCTVGETKVAHSLKMTPRAQEVLTLAGKQMRELGHAELDSRHLLLGLLLEEEGIAGRLLRGRGITLEAVRRAMESDKSELHAPRREEPAPVTKMTERTPIKSLLNRFSRT